MKEIFSEIHRTNAWGSAESVSGPGSTVERTAAFRNEVERLLRDLGVTRLLDAACGDFNWIKELQFDFEHYVGVDIVDEIITRNRSLHGRKNRSFLTLDITRDELPEVDMILCRDCFVHFSLADITKAIHNFKRSRSRYLLTTTFTRFTPNIDIPTGGWRQINLQIEPFAFPEPLYAIDEKCHHTDGIYADKCLSLWRLEDLRL